MASWQDNAIGATAAGRIPIKKGHFIIVNDLQRYEAHFLLSLFLNLWLIRAVSRKKYYNCYCSWLLLQICFTKPIQHEEYDMFYYFHTGSKCD